MDHYGRAALGVNDAIRACPEDPFAQRRLNVQASSYVISDYISEPGPDCIHNLNKLDATSRTMIVFEAANPPYSEREHMEDDAKNFYDHVHATEWFRPLNEQLGIVRTGDRARHPTGSPRGTAHYLYADGHVEAIAAVANR